MRLNDIIERFTLVSGLERKDVSRYLLLIVDCRDYFEQRLRDDLSEADMRRAVHACAVYAFYKISMLSAKDAVDTFKAGDVQFGLQADRADIKSMWDSERAAVADILDIDDDFVFRSVRV